MSCTSCKFPLTSKVSKDGRIYLTCPKGVYKGENPCDKVFFWADSNGNPIVKTTNKKVQVNRATTFAPVFTASTPEPMEEENANIESIMTVITELKKISAQINKNHNTMLSQLAEVGIDIDAMKNELQKGYNDSIKVAIAAKNNASTNKKRKMVPEESTDTTDSIVED